MNNLVRRPVLTMVALLAAFALIAAACGDDSGGGAAEEPAEEPADAPAEEQSFDVVIAMSAAFETIDPTLVGTPDEAFGHGNISETLTDIAGGDVVPVLATSWELVDDLTWRFELREDVEFTNGEPFNSDAVLFSLDYLLGGDVEGVSAIASYFENYGGVVAVDEYTVDITGLSPWGDLPRLMATPVMYPPEHMAAGGPNAYNDEPVGTGPYIFDFAEGGEYVLTQNPGYWGGGLEDAPDTVRFVERTDASTRVAALLAGEVDIIAALPIQLVDQVPVIESGVSSTIVSLFLNGVRPPLDDPRVREAISLAIDSDGIRDALMGDFAELATCQLAGPTVAGFNPDLEAQAYDPDRARELVEETGVQGESIRLIVRAQTEGEGHQAATIAAEQLREVGFQIEFETVTLEQFVDEITLEDRAARQHIAVSAPSSSSGSVTQPWSVWIADAGPLSVFPILSFPTSTRPSTNSD